MVFHGQVRVLAQNGGFICREAAVHTHHYHDGNNRTEEWKN